MKTLLRLEEGGMLLLSLLLFSGTGFAWWWFPVLILTPDLSMIGYLAGARYGAAVYNLFHHRGMAVAVYLGGIYFDIPWLQLGGIILFAHASIDRMFGYGLKYGDAFDHTHLDTDVGGATPVDG